MPLDGPQVAPGEEFSRLIANFRNTLRFMAACGCNGFDTAIDKRRLDQLGKLGSDPILPGETLEEIRTDLGDCRRCGLCRYRTNIVFGAGDPRARLVFVGEGPGEDEDLSGEPFVGRAGRLLDRIIDAMKLVRESVYICNIVKCRPPANRTPLPEEIECCVPFLERQIAAVSPDVICTLGATATRSLLKIDAPISRLRGRFHDYRGIRVMPTYHPAYLLRYPERKRETWEDIKMILKVMALI
ncbi:MAG: uracil-DNA glycosylase [Desulfococcus multivorans]|jgi:DNA polymerase|uniref:uracil-DNA glycosylase n=1 Tax=Desulfococcus sp. TaxID=2025834 RepID=UPI002A3DB589|nr:uracil-DNA glycosylase [Desulfococcus multivorans]